MAVELLGFCFNRVVESYLARGAGFRTSLGLLRVAKVYVVRFVWVYLHGLSLMAHRAGFRV